MKIRGLQKAVGDYRRYTSAGAYSPRYGNIMFNPEDGCLWTDEFYSLGHNSWKQYENKYIVNISAQLERLGLPITMENIKGLIGASYPEFR